MRHAGRALLLLLPLVALAACGDDSPAAAPEASETLPPVDTAPPTPARYDVPTGADEAVIAASNEGGFAPPGAVFTRAPLAVITGDGRALATGPVTAVYPGPLLPNIQQRSITPAGVQRLVAKADELGLLRDVTYSSNDMVADASDTVVDITVGGRTYHHRAYALGLDDAQDVDRQHLLTFVDALGDLPSTVGADALGPEQPVDAEQYLIKATAVDPATQDTELPPTIVPWPDDAPVRLADATTCATLPAAVAEPLFDDATVLTWFVDGDVTYSVAAVQQIAGRGC